MSTSRTSVGFGRSLLMSSLLVTALVAAGCSGDDSEKDAGKTGSESTATASHDPKVPSGDNGDLVDPTGARADLVGFKCASKAGRWAATGTVKNSSKEDAAYLVQVTVHSTEGGTVLGTAEETLDVKAGKKADIDFANIYSGKEKKLECTARVVRGS